jgi:hypothetical protein
MKKLVDIVEAGEIDEDETFKQKDAEIQDSNVTLKQCLDSFVTPEVRIGVCTHAYAFA